MQDVQTVEELQVRQLLQAWHNPVEEFDKMYVVFGQDDKQRVPYI